MDKKGYREKSGMPTGSSLNAEPGELSRPGRTQDQRCAEDFGAERAKSEAAAVEDLR